MTLSENAPLKLTIGFLLLGAAFTWKAATIVSETEKRIDNLEALVATIKAEKDSEHRALWQGMGNRADEAKSDIESARELVEHQLSDLEGDVDKLGARLDFELDKHHHHGTQR